jgi:hypothetical protein
MRPTTASTASVDVHDLAGDGATEVQRKQWASATVRVASNLRDHAPESCGLDL